MKWKSLALVCAFLIGGFALLQPKQAKADDWPCEVILCMSNPGGATQFSQCVPPMEEFWKCMASPTCTFPGCNEDGVNANISYEPDYLCPTGTEQSGVFGEGRASEGAACVFHGKQGNTYTMSPVYNPYNLAFKIAWANGGETLYLDQANQTESLTDPRPSLSAAQIAYWNSLPPDYDRGGR